jgi:predicted adenylyl cyclase CyaB
MAHNIEIKARVKNPEHFLAQAMTLADGPQEIISQKDTFFKVSQGRLKLRDFGNGTGQLIRYHRPDRAGPKISDYAISPTNDPEGLCNVLKQSLSEIGTVTKRRTLLMSGRTRIHLDEVENLGWFMELEVVLTTGEDPDQGEREANLLMRELGVKPEDLIQGAYLDLLDRKR